MMPVRRTQSWLPSIFNDFFDNDWMVKANATAPAINVFETEKEYKVELAAPKLLASKIVPFSKIRYAFCTISSSFFTQIFTITIITQPPAFVKAFNTFFSFYFSV